MRWHRKDVDIARIALLDDIVDPAQQTAAAVWIKMFACKTQRAAAALLDQFARQRREAAALPFGCGDQRHDMRRSEEHTSELQSLMRISYAVFCLKKKNNRNYEPQQNN